MLMGSIPLGDRSRMELHEALRSHIESRCLRLERRCSPSKCSSTNARIRDTHGFRYIHPFLFICMVVVPFFGSGWVLHCLEKCKQETKNMAIQHCAGRGINPTPQEKSICICLCFGSRKRDSSSEQYDSMHSQMHTKMVPEHVGFVEVRHGHRVLGVVPVRPGGLWSLDSGPLESASQDDTGHWDTPRAICLGLQPQYLRLRRQPPPFMQPFFDQPKRALNATSHPRHFRLSFRLSMPKCATHGEGGNG